ncbi:hypothetical protein OL548_27905 [Lysinibacillus sp. MHQ-1]|nr:hypothetical protein OL548_27905 [Lysinibacillus sp. MHQ-1]
MDYTYLRKNYTLTPVDKDGSKLDTTIKIKKRLAMNENLQTLNLKKIYFPCMMDKKAMESSGEFANAMGDFFMFH